MIRRTDSSSSRMKSPWFGGALLLSILFACVLFDRTSYSQQGLDLASLGTGQDEDPVTLSAQFSLKQDQSGVLTVTAKLSPGWHIYSVTQPSGGPIKTSFKVNTVGVELVGPPSPITIPNQSQAKSS